MFSVKGTVVSGNDEKKSVIVRLSEEEYNKVNRETVNVQFVFEDGNIQPILPCWKYQDAFYCKILLSKARRENYEALLNLVGDNLFNLKVIPYSFTNSNTGKCNGYSLYYQGEFTIPKKFKKTNVTV
jgi:hypothetical protein